MFSSMWPLRFVSKDLINFSEPSFGTYMLIRIKISWSLVLLINNLCPSLFLITYFGLNAIWSKYGFPGIFVCLVGCLVSIILNNCFTTFYSCVCVVILGISCKQQANGFSFLIHLVILCFLIYKVSLLTFRDVVDKRSVLSFYYVGLLLLHWPIWLLGGAFQ